LPHDRVCNSLACRSRGTVACLTGRVQRSRPCHPRSLGNRVSAGQEYLKRRRGADFFASQVHERTGTK